MYTYALTALTAACVQDLLYSGPRHAAHTSALLWAIIVQQAGCWGLLLQNLPDQHASVHRDIYILYILYMPYLHAK